MSFDQEKEPNKALEPTRPAVTDRAPSSTLRASRSCGSPMTLGKFMIRHFTVFVALTSGILFAADPNEALEVVRSSTEGYVALCRESVIDELQIVAGPR